MLRNLSHTHLSPTLSKSSSKRGIYINEQTSKRQVNTHFHSPYKDGKPNQNYINPSFVSSHLFYPKEALQNKQYVIRNSHIPNNNDIKKQELFRQRIKTQAQNTLQVLSKHKQNRNHTPRGRQFKKTNPTQSRVMRLNDPHKNLQNQLQTLQNYRQNIIGTKQHIQQVSRKIYNDTYAEIPIYLEKQHNYNHSLQVENKKKNDHSNLSRQITHLKKEYQADTFQQQKIQKLILYNKQALREQEVSQRRQAQLLGGILRQQIKTNQAKRKKTFH